MRILLDANALMIPSQFRIDLFDALRDLVGNIEPVVLPAVLRELQKLAQGKGSSGTAARCGLILAESCRVVESCHEGTPVDEQILMYAKASGCVVLTNDRVLRSALLSENVPVITLKNQKKLDILRK